jgi:hypothetical protein
MAPPASRVTSSSRRLVAIIMPSLSYLLQGVLHQSEQLIAIQGELDVAARGHDGDRGLGPPGLVGSMVLRIGSFQDASSCLVKGNATSCLTPGQEEPPSSIFN